MHVPLWVLILSLVAWTPWAAAGQRQNLNTGSPDYCSTVQNTAGTVIAGGCQTLIVSSLTNNGDGTYTISGGAPTDADYILGTANASLSAEQSLGALTTGLTLNTVSGSTGTLSAYGGTSCTNQFPRSLNASGVATCADVTLTTDTAGNYVGSVADGTGIDGTASGEGATYTPSLDLTEINSATFGDGSFTTLTFNAGATDPVWTYGSGTVTLAPGGSDFILSDDLELQDATPHVRLTPSSGDAFELYAHGSAVYLTDVTNSLVLLQGLGTGTLRLPQLTNCNTIDTDGNGTLSCGSDEGGAGGDSVLIDGVAVSDASGVDLQGGAGVDITFNAGASPDTASFVSDFTEISSLTWGAGSFTTMTFDAGATDPVITAGNGVLTIAPGGSDLTISDDTGFSDGSPNIWFRDTTDNVAYMLHVDTAALYPFEIFRGTDSGSGFSQTVRLAMFNTSNDFLIPQKVAIGGVAPVVGGRLTVNGSVGTDEIQLLITGSNPQTANLITAENIAGTDQFTLSNIGNGVFNGTLTVGGTAQSTITEGLIVNNASGTDEDDDFTVNVSGGAYEIDAGAGTFTGTVDSAGWSEVDGTDNTAGTAQCTSTCLFGILNATGTAVTGLVDCADTAADQAMCMGPS